MAQAEADQTMSEEDENLGPFRRWAKGAMQDPESTYRGLFYLVMVFFLFTTLFPLYWLLVLALTPSNNIVNMGLLPKGFNPGAFVEIFQRLPFHVYMFNSFVLALLTTAIVLVLASLAGYVFGRLDFPGRGPLMLLILAISYFPPAAFLIPLFRLFTGNIEILGLSTPMLYNTPGALLLPFSALFMPLSIFILTTFYSQIPDGLEDAARIEGTTRLGALFRVIIPLSAPGVATAGVLTFINVYNEFFFSYLMTDGEAQHWAPILWGILGYQGQYASFYNLMAAASIVGILPIAILVVIAQEKIVSGLTSGALKE
ncbi:carbohydrate ABC transporter permease [Haladaptatus sp. DYF46]|uniref:carbohydrate ABC transporter permease n=1 Tax=Haladaptatus sp. DYF46 TaxID=2886041 RepID=UPI001E30F09F|nr:carbohydrate ABC transporter permease [Haladaptatus sp. DYF46]